MGPAADGNDELQAALSSRLLEPLRVEAARHLRDAEDNGDNAGQWQDAFDAVVHAMSESEQVAAARFPGRLGRRDWSSRPVVGHEAQRRPAESD